MRRPSRQAVHFKAGSQHDGQDSGDQRRRGLRIEEATYEGVRSTPPSASTVPQSLAVAEAIERGLNRRAAAGKPIDHMRPVCTIMIGRLDDWIHVLEARQHHHRAGLSAIGPASPPSRRLTDIYQERGYRTRLLAAAYRHHLHWSELIGGDIVMTIPYEWQRLFNGSDIEVKPRFQDPVPQEIVDTLYAKFPDFRRAYDADWHDRQGVRPRSDRRSRTLRAFIGSYRDLLAVIRDFMLPNTDVKK